MITRIKIFLIAALLAFLPAASAQVGPMPGMGPSLLIAGKPPVGTPTALGSGVTTGTPSALTMIMTGPIPAGSTPTVCAGSRSNAGRTVASVSDGTNSYTLGVAANDGVNDTEIWYKANASPVSSGATITVTLNAAITGGGNGGFVIAAQVTGITPVSPLDKTANQAITTSTPSVTTSSLSQSVELAIGCAAIYPTTTTYTESSGFSTIGTQVNSSGLLSANISYQKTSSSSAVTYAPAWGVSDAANTALITLKN